MMRYCEGIMKEGKKINIRIYRGKEIKEGRSLFET